MQQTGSKQSFESFFQKLNSQGGLEALKQEYLHRNTPRRNVDIPGLGKYYGQTKENANIPHGAGTLLAHQNKTYQGTFQDGSLVRGVIKVNRQLCVYSGDLNNFKMHGQGHQKIFSQNDYRLGSSTAKQPTVLEEYFGQFKYDERNGEGMLIDHRTKTKYMGTFRNNEKNGCFWIYSAQSPANPPVYIYYRNGMQVEQINLNSEPIAYCFGSHVQEARLRSLRPGEELFPSILYAYCQILEKNYNQWAAYNSGPRILMLNGFMQKLFGQNLNGFWFENVQNYHPFYSPQLQANKQPLFDFYDLLIMPFQLFNNHFALVLIEIKRSDSRSDLAFRVSYLDSLHYESQSIRRNIQTYLRHETLRCFDPSSSKAYSLMRSIERLVFLDNNYYNQPKQENSVDCGVWVAMYVKQLLKSLKSNGYRFGSNPFLYLKDKNGYSCDRMRVEIAQTISNYKKVQNI